MRMTRPALLGLAQLGVLTFTVIDLASPQPWAVWLIAASALAVVALGDAPASLGMRRTAAVLALLTVALLPTLAAPGEVVEQGIRIGGLISSILMSVALLSRAAQRVALLRQVVVALLEVPVRRRGLSMALATQLFGGFLGFAGISMLMEVASQRPATAQERLQCFRRISRGFAAANLWSPMFSNISILLALSPGLSWARVFPLAVLLALASLALGLALDRVHPVAGARADGGDTEDAGNGGSVSTVSAMTPLGTVAAVREASAVGAGSSVGSIGLVRLAQAVESGTPGTGTGTVTGTAGAGAGIAKPSDPAPPLEGAGLAAVLRAAWPVFACMCAVLTCVLGLSIAAHLPVAAIIIVAAPLGALVLAATLGPGPRGLRGAAGQLAADFRGLRPLAGEVRLLMASGCAGTVIAAAIPAAWTAPLSAALAPYPVLGCLFLASAVVLLSCTSVHPMLSGIVVAGAFPAAAMGLPPVAHVLTVLAGLGLAVTTTPFSVVSLSASRFSGLPLLTVSMRANLGFAALSTVLVGLLLGGAADYFPR
ncbi:hypothetical protein WG922_11370 [Ramlibacter sp. AN1015]|uniref:hypothetical protein n=1 Tax=Ramlibacter sp. AN1015 TaxID=3133428 RepID=UPI0030C5467D